MIQKKKVNVALSVDELQHSLALAQARIIELEVLFCF